MTKKFQITKFQNNAMAKETLGIATSTIDFPENIPVDPAAVAETLAADSSITPVAV